MIVFADAEKLLVCLDHEITLRTGADPHTMRLDQMFDRGADLALADFKFVSVSVLRVRKTIDLLDEPFSRDGEVLALMGLEKMENVRFEIV